MSDCRRVELLCGRGWKSGFGIFPDLGELVILDSRSGHLNDSQYAGLLLIAAEGQSETGADAGFTEWNTRACNGSVIEKAVSGLRGRE